ncbi:MAG: MCE family protein [Planctomycetes bacterium]|nr:MCE family protein [Planctomycetota bacterium]
MTANRSFLLGLFFIAALGVLGYYTLFLTNFSLFKQPNEMLVHFSRTNGLREGDAVQVAGMRWGRVKQLTFDPKAPQERRVTVLASLNDPLELREGFKIAIEDATLLGGRNLAIDPGPAEGQPIAKDAVLIGSVAPNPLTALGDLVKESKANVEQTISDIASLTRGVRDGKGPLGRLFRDENMATGLSDFVADASKAVANLERISADLAAGKGTAGRLLSDPSLYDELRDATKRLSTLSDNVNAIALQVQKGEGLAGKLFYDEQWAREFQETVQNVNRITRKIDSGDGTLARLVNDPTLVDDAQKIVSTIAAGKGSVGKAIMKEELYDNLNETTENLAIVTGTVRSGQGSLGRLIMDEELYVQVKSMLSIVQRALEEYREAAPITTFTSIFFNAF